MPDSVKILFLAAAPYARPRLELDIELRTIKQQMRSSTYANQIEVSSEWAVRDDDLLLHMNNYHPNIVHFSGHGTSTGELIFEGANRSSKPISNRAIKALFQNFKRYTNLVILNACHTEAQAKAIAEDIDCVIGTNQAIGDESAIGFISSFYGALGFGASVEAAFQQGITQLLIKNLPGEHTPVLFTRPGIDASQITLKELAQTSKPQTSKKSGEDTVAMSSQAKDRPVSIFISYAQQDESYCTDIEKHFSVMKRNKEIKVQHIGTTLAGESVLEKQQEYIDTADIILLLISPDFMSSEDLYENELRPAIYRRSKGLSIVIPIIICPTTDWEEDKLFGKISSLPKDKGSIARWSNRDSAINSIMKDLRIVINQIKK